MDLLEIVETAKETAKKAGDLVMYYYHKGVSVEKKEGLENPAYEAFTIADTKAQDLILSSLQPLTDRYDFGILAEESVDDSSRFEKEYFWCIDPLDGTLPFTEQKEGFSISIALVSNKGEAVVGVIYNPIKEDLYHAAKGHGAYKNNQLFTWQNQPFSTLVCDRSFLKTPHYQKAKEVLKPQKEISFGGACMNAMWVIENAPALYYKPPKNNLGNGSIWDYASSSIIFRELTLQATSFDGSPLPLNQKNTFMNECGILYSSLLNDKDIIHRLR
ncbi:hypothetical protein NH26_21385 [Flammeovirga pacifica]|uniref:Inositol monophosphatase n=1 Tax=Flammeovirga pacifica TaxID=915059 RepID=A0A1S1YUS0_FLAPC|nr:hypothetical protein NH26_21385 [Flammeovirga pacifica]